jgi:hypothetical protein
MKQYHRGVGGYSPCPVVAIPRAVPFAVPTSKEKADGLTATGPWPCCNRSGLCSLAEEDLRLCSKSTYSCLRRILKMLSARKN